MATVARWRGGRTLAELWRAGGFLVPLVVLCFALAGSAPTFLRPSNLSAIAEQSAIPLVAAIGMTFVVLMGGIDLSLAGTMAAASVAVSLLVANSINGNDFGLWGVLAAILLGGLIGLANGLIHAYAKLPSFIVTLGTGSIGTGIGTSLLFFFAGAGAPGVTDEGFRSLAYANKGGFSYLTILALGLVVLAYIVQRHTLLGRRTVAIGGGESLASLSGIKVQRYKVAIFTLAGLIFGLAGVMTSARLGVGTVQVGDNLLFSTITAVVLGGTPLSGGAGGVVNSVVGVLTLSVLNDGMILWGVPPFYQQALEGIIILTVLTASGWALRGRLRVVK